MSKIPADGIYASKAHGTEFFAERNVYIQNGTVRLVMDDCKYLFSYYNFFAVNVLGERLADLPKDFEIQGKAE